MNFATYFAIEKKAKGIGISLDRTEMVDQFTDGRKNGLSQLTPHEYREFIVFLNNLLKAESQQSEADQRQRRKVIALLAQIGYVTPERKSDMKRINEWCKSHGHLHIELGYYKGEDLTMLVTQAQEYYNQFIRDFKA